jgi:hypothetical protein
MAIVDRHVFLSPCTWPALRWPHLVPATLEARLFADLPLDGLATAATTATA